MGGIQRYPIPKWFHSTEYVFNKNWKKNTLSILGGNILLGFVLHRHINLSEYQKPPSNFFVNPDSPEFARIYDFKQNP